MTMRKSIHPHSFLFIREPMDGLSCNGRLEKACVFSFHLALDFPLPDEEKNIHSRNIFLNFSTTSYITLGECHIINNKVFLSMLKHYLFNSTTK